MQIWMSAAGSLIVVVLDALSATRVAFTATGSITAKIGGGIWRAGRRTASGLRSPLMVLIAWASAWPFKQCMNWVAA